MFAKVADLPRLKCTSCGFTYPDYSQWGMEKDDGLCPTCGLTHEINKVVQK